jgi:hypothetical protein
MDRVTDMERVSQTGREWETERDRERESEIETRKESERETGAESEREGQGVRIFIIEGSVEGCWSGDKIPGEKGKDVCVRMCVCVRVCGEGGRRGEAVRVSLGSLTQISHTELMAGENNDHQASGNPSCRSVKEKKNKI